MNTGVCKQHAHTSRSHTQWFCSPIAWPLGKLLDWILGHEAVVMRRSELKAMVELHGETAGVFWESLLGGGAG